MATTTVSERLERMVAKFGPWTYDIPLGDGVWTRGEPPARPHTRLRRTLQMIEDLGRKPLADCRLLDLGCLDGLFSIECGLHGAEVVGIDARRANIAKSEFSRDVLNLDRVTFVEDDVRNLTAKRYGRFDVVICSGLLYHLEAPDVFGLLETMYAIAERLVVIDTHISLAPTTTYTYNGESYAGHHYEEHHEKTDRDEKLWASWRNRQSFWLTRPSLVNALTAVGFSSVYDCLAPVHIDFTDLSNQDRCAFAAIKGSPVSLETSQGIADRPEGWPEGALAYGGPGNQS